MTTGKSLPFKQFMVRNFNKLPIVFEIEQGCYGNVPGGTRDFSTGEILRAESIEHVVNVTFSDVYSISSERGLITLPPTFNGLFQLASAGSKRRQKTVKDLLSDENLLPCVVYSDTDIQYNNVKIPKNTKVSMLKAVSFNRKDTKFVLCKVFLPTEMKNILLPRDTSGYFKDIRKLYTLKDLLPKMPVKVIPVTDEPGERIPGIPETFDDVIFLSKIDVVCCRPVADTSEIIRIPTETDFNVMRRFISNDYFNMTKNIHDLIKSETKFPICVEVVDFDDALKVNGGMKCLQTEQLLIVEGINDTDKILAKGKQRYFTIPEEYAGKFKMMPKIYQTADDLWQERYNKKVRTTENYEVDNPNMDSVFIGDILTAKEMRVMSFGHQEYEVIFCDREHLKSGSSQTICIPSYTFGRFEEVDYPKQPFTLDHSERQLPFRAKLHTYKQPPSEEDILLRDDGPLTFEVLFNEMDILVSVFDESKNTTIHPFFIPEHKVVRVKKRMMPKCYKPGYKPCYNVTERPTIDLLSEVDYKSMCLTHNAYMEPPPIAPPVPPREGAKPKTPNRAESLQVSSDSDDDYSKPYDMSGMLSRQTISNLGNSYVVHVPKKSAGSLTSSLNTLKKKLRRNRSETKSPVGEIQKKCPVVEGKNKSPISEFKKKLFRSESEDEFKKPNNIKMHISDEEHDYIKPIPNQKDNGDEELAYMKPMHHMKDPEVVMLGDKLADLEVSTDVIQKVYESNLTETAFKDMLKTCSEAKLMQTLGLKKLEIIALRDLFK